MTEGSVLDSLESVGYAVFVATGDAAVGAFQCAECGYGVTVRRTLPLCPMCGGTAWEPSAWRPFTRRREPPPS